jgi:hypothetical protein
MKMRVSIEAVSEGAGRRASARWLFFIILEVAGRACLSHL